MIVFDTHLLLWLNRADPAFGTSSREHMRHTDLVDRCFDATDMAQEALPEAQALWSQRFQRCDQLGEPGSARRHWRHAAKLQRF